MKRREKWQRVLGAEIRTWAAKSYEQLRSELAELRVYEVEFDSEKYQVEVEMLACDETCVHVAVAIDDGSLPASIFPATDSFIRNKTP